MDPHFDRATALGLAQLVQLAYSLPDLSAEAVTAAAAALGRQIEELIYVNDAAGLWRRPDVPIGLIASAPDHLAVVFRGTDSLLEAIEDVRFAHADIGWLAGRCRACRAEKGFYALYQSLRLTDRRRRPLEAVLATAAPTVRIAGHSLGGALATLFAAELAVQAPFARPAAAVYTFGSPRTGDKAFAAAYDASVPTSYRVVNPHDLVPSLPVELAGYAHVDQLVSLPVPAGTPHGLLVSHSIDTYAELLGAMTPPAPAAQAARSPP